MSTDYYLYSPSTGKRAQVGSIGLGGVQSYPGSEDVAEFIRWVLTNFKYADVKMVSEHELAVDDERFGRDQE